MNVRIRELMEQAMELVDPYAVEGEFGPRRLNEQKFAELIVKECAHIAWLYDEPKLSGHGAIIANSIKEQFGVEETKGWVCPKCGTDRTKAVCPKGHHAAVTGDCPMVGVAQ